MRQRRERVGPKGVFGVVFPMGYAKIPFGFPIRHPATRDADGTQSIGRLVATYERVLHVSHNQGDERFPHAFENGFML